MSTTKGSPTQEDGDGLRMAGKAGTVDLHSMVWLINQAGGEHGPYFVLSIQGDRLMVARHYVSETPGGKFSQWGTPVLVAPEYCLLKPKEKRPRLYCRESWDWFLGTYAKAMLKDCPPIEIDSLRIPND